MSKLRPEVMERITSAISIGGTYEHACRYGGITHQTFRNWILRGEAELQRRAGGRVKPGTAQWQAEQPYVDFYEAVREAEADAANRWLYKIQESIEGGDVRSAQWMLERRYPKDYARRNYAKIEGMDQLIAIAERKGLSLSEVVGALVDVLSEDDDTGA